MPVDVEAYGQALLRRVAEARRLRRAEIAGGDWQPQPNWCHANVSVWCEVKEGYTPVRGWLYFDLPGLAFCSFVAHSALRAPNGELYDITPSRTSAEYPFLEGGLSEDEYAELVETRGMCNLEPRKSDA